MNFENLIVKESNNDICKSLRYFIGEKEIAYIEYQIYEDLDDLQYIEGIILPQNIIENYNSNVVLNHINVSNAFRNTGIGTHILTKFLEKFNNYDFVILQIASTSGNLEERKEANEIKLPKFYSKFGFKKDTNIRTSLFGMKNTETFYIKINN